VKLSKCYHYQRYGVCFAIDIVGTEVVRFMPDFAKFFAEPKTRTAVHFTYFLQNQDTQSNEEEVKKFLFNDL